MSDVRDQLAESLHRHADPVSAGPGLAQAAHRRALRLRLKRRIAAGVTCLIVLAVGVPVGYNLLGGPARTEIAPVETPTPKHTLPAKASRVALDVGKLKQGEAPKVVWYTTDTIHDSDGRSIPVKGLNPEASITIRAVDGGFLVLEDCCEGIGVTQTTARLLDLGGQTIRTLFSKSYNSAPVVSSDGRQAAWAEPDSGDGVNSAGTLVVADLTTGDVLHRKHVDRISPTVAGFLGGRVVWTGGADGDRSSGVWDPASGEVSMLAGVSPILQAAGGPLVVAETTPHPESRCQRVVDTAHGNREVWEKCGFTFSMSDDGRHVLGRAELNPGLPTTVFGAADGRALLEIVTPDDTSIGAWAVEPSGDVLLLVRADTRMTLVRCTLSGRCERATDYFPEPAGWGSTLTLPSSR